MIKYDKLFAKLKADGKSSTYWLRKNGFYPAVVSRLRKNGRVTTDTIDRLCAVLKCQPGDVMEYVEDAKEKENEKGNDLTNA